MKNSKSIGEGSGRFSSHLFNSIRLIIAIQKENQISLSQSSYYLLWCRRLFVQMKNDPGIFFCDKHLLRLEAKKAYANNNTAHLVTLCENATDLVIKAEAMKLLQPSHIKTLAWMRWLLGKAYFENSDRVKSDREYNECLRILSALHQQYPDYNFSIEI